jgi:hypothetical protein
MEERKDGDVGSIEAYEPTLLEKAGQKVQQMAEDLGLSRTAARKLGNAATFTGEMAPGTGDVDAVEQTKRALGEGNYFEAGINAAAIIPFVGKALRKGAKVSMELYRSADSTVQRIALREASEKLGRIPNPDNAEDVDTLVQTAAEVEDRFREVKKGVSAEERGLPERTGREVYHAAKGDKRAFVEEYGIAPSMHAELQTNTVSTSSDPIYSARHFGDGEMTNLFKGEVPEDATTINMSPTDYSMQHEGMINIQEGVDEPTYTLKPDVADIYGMDTDTPLTQINLDEWGIPLEDVIEHGDEDFYAKIPKLANYNSEAETIVGNPDALKFVEVADDPKLAAFIKEGVDETEQVMDTQDTLRSGLVMLSEQGTLSPANAKKMYNRIRDNMKQALSLAKYTADNSARGTYDWYLGNWVKADPAISKGLKVLADSLPGEQLKDNVMQLNDLITSSRDKLSEAGLDALPAAAPDVGREVSSTIKTGGRDVYRKKVKMLAEKHAKGMIDDEMFQRLVKEEAAKVKQGAVQLTEKFAEGGLVSS